MAIDSSIKEFLGIGSFFLEGVAKSNEIIWAPVQDKFGHG